MQAIIKKIGNFSLHFPDNNAELKDIDSRILLKRIFDLMKKNKFIIGNLDVTILAQEPKMVDYISKGMQNTIFSLRSYYPWERLWFKK